jgi:hypothetical protein
VGWEVCNVVNNVGAMNVFKKDMVKCRRNIHITLWYLFSDVFW